MKNFNLIVRAIIGQLKIGKNANFDSDILDALKDKKVLNAVNEGLEPFQQIFNKKEVFLAPIAKSVFTPEGVFGEVERYVFVTIKESPSIFNKNTGTYYVLGTDETIYAKSDFKYSTEPHEYIIVPEHLYPLTKMLDERTNRLYDYLTRRQIVDFEEKYVAKTNNPERVL